MLLCSHLMQIYDDAVGSKFPLVSAVNGRGMPKRSLAISKVILFVKIGRPLNLIPKMAVQSRGRIAYYP